MGWVAGRIYEIRQTKRKFSGGVNDEIGIPR